MLFKHFRRPVLIAGVLVGGASLVAGSARATTWDSECFFGPTYTTNTTACTGPSGAGWTTVPSSPAPPSPSVPPMQLGDKLLNILSYSFGNFIAGSAVVPSGQFNFNWNDAGTPSPNDDNWSVRTVFDSTVTGIPGTPATGTMNYTLDVISITSQYKSVRIDSASTGNGGTVLKTIISPPVSITSVNGGIVDAPLSGSFVNVTDTYAVANTAGMNSFNNGFQQQDADPIPPLVPGPLPLFGLGAAFGFSRRLRNRIKGSRLA